MRNILGLKSGRDSALIKKFTVLFSLMSLLPFVILAAVFFTFVAKGQTKINSDLFFLIVFSIGIFAFAGFLTIRKTFTNLIKVSQDAKDILAGNLSKRINIKTAGDAEIKEIARAFNEVVQQLENNIEQLEKSRNTLQSVLLKVSKGVSSTENINVFLDLILETTVDALDGKSGLLLIIDEAQKELIIKSSYGLDDAYSKNKRIPLEEEIVGWVIKQKKPLLIPRLNKIVVTEGKSPAFTPPLICAPLIFQGKVIGAISVSGKKQEVNFQEDELIILSNLASQIALAMENARLNADNQKIYLETITALALAVEARDLYSRGHCDRMNEYSVKLARALGLDAERIEIIRQAAQLHDVGKIGVSDEILKKAGPLNELERKLIEQHPAIGEGIIIPLHGFWRLRDPVRHHHEWLNGQGYPDHLKGNEISLEARILAVVDSFDAMTTDRPYRKAMDLQEAKQELLKYKGIRYDEKVVDTFIKIMNL